MQKHEIEEMLSKFPFVRWDRFTEKDGQYTIFGWIDRPQDSYKDFLVITIYEDGDAWLTTSSAEKHDEIMQISGALPHQQTTCQRVENHFSIPNMIKL